MRQQKQQLAFKNQEDEKEEMILKGRQLSNSSSNYNSELSTQPRQSQFYQSSPSSSREPQLIYQKKLSPKQNNYYQEQASPQSRLNSSTSSYLQHQRRYQQEQDELIWQQQQYYYPQSQVGQKRYYQEYHSASLMKPQYPDRQYQNYYYHQKASSQEQEPQIYQQQCSNINNNIPSIVQQPISQLHQTSQMMTLMKEQQNKQKEQDYTQYLEQENARLFKQCQQQMIALSQSTQVPQQKPFKSQNCNLNSDPYNHREIRNYQGNNYQYKRSELFSNQINYDYEYSKGCVRSDDDNYDDFEIKKRDQTKQLASSLEWPLPEELIKVYYLQENIQRNVYKDVKRKQFYIIGEDVSELCNDIQKKYKYLYVNQVSIHQYIVGSKSYSIKVNKMIQILKEYYSQQQSKRNNKSSLYIKERNNYKGNKNSSNNNNNKDHSLSPHHSTIIKTSKSNNNQSKHFQINYGDNEGKEECEFCFNKNSKNQSQNQEIRELRQMVLEMLEQQQKLQQKSQIQQYFLSSPSCISSTQNHHHRNAFQNNKNQYDSQIKKPIEKQQSIFQENLFQQYESECTDINEELEEKITMQQNQNLFATSRQIINTNKQQQQQNQQKHQQVNLNKQDDSTKEVMKQGNNIFQNHIENKDQQLQQYQQCKEQFQQFNQDQDHQQDQQQIIDQLQRWQSQQKQEIEEQEKKTILFQEQMVMLFEQLQKEVKQISAQLQQQKEKNNQYEEQQQGQEQAQIKMQYQEYKNEMKQIKNAILQVNLQQRLRDEFRSFVIEQIKDKKIQNIKTLNLDELYGEIQQLFLEQNKQFSSINNDESVTGGINFDQICHNNQYLKGIFCDVFISSQGLIKKIAQQNQREGDILKSKGGKSSSNNKISMGKFFDYNNNKNNNTLLNPSIREGEESNNIIGKSNTKRNPIDRHRSLSSNQI